jgi:hypothetical protein
MFLQVEQMPVTLVACTMCRTPFGGAVATRIPRWSVPRLDAGTAAKIAPSFRDWDLD